MDRRKKQKLGQCFLIDLNVVQKIVAQAGVEPGALVVEVGPGKGILTKAILGAGMSVYALEIDRELCAKLVADLGGDPTFNLTCGNALKYDFGSIANPFHIISNLPYSVSVPLIKKFMERLDKVLSMTLMTQREVALRLSAKPGDKHYASLSIYMAYHCQVDYLFTIGPEAFRPRPKVDSAVIRIVPKSRPPVIVDNEETFFKFVRTSFVHRRKTLRNNLKGLWESEDRFMSACAHADLNPKTRPQDVSIEKFASLYNRLPKPAP